MCVRINLFFFNDTATTEIYTLSLHDALPIFAVGALLAGEVAQLGPGLRQGEGVHRGNPGLRRPRSEEHTSELQSRQYLVCRLLLEKKKDIHPSERPGVYIGTKVCPTASLSVS